MQDPDTNKKEENKEEGSEYNVEREVERKQDEKGDKILLIFQIFSDVFCCMGYIPSHDRTVGMLNWE
jgi:hypothetical protein